VKRTAENWDRTFKPTHEITVHYANGDILYAPVMLVDGAAYSHCEWANDAAADWECNEDGEWTFQGRPHPSTGTVTIEKRNDA
jgi:hypothetical protein